MVTRALAAALVGGSLVLGLTTVVGAGSPAAATVGPHTSWSMRADEDDYLVADDEYYYDAGDGIEMYGDADSVNGYVDGWRVTIAAPQGEDLEVGRTYTGATRASFAGPGEPGLELSGNGSACSTVTGSFTVHELTFSLLGDLESVVFTFEQHCDGEAAAAYGSIAWQASQPAPVLPPLLETVMQAKRIVAYGGTATVAAHLSADSPIRELMVYGQSFGESPRLLRTVTVDQAGNASIPLRLTRTTRVTVRFDGRGQYPDRSRQHMVHVAGKVTSRMYRPARKSGRYAVYPVSRNPFIKNVMRPNHRGDCLQFRVEFRVRGSWGYDGVLRCVKLDKRSVAWVRFVSDPRLVGIPVRVRSEWHGDKQNAKATGRWAYFKFVRGHASRGRELPPRPSRGPGLPISVHLLPTTR